MDERKKVIGFYNPRWASKSPNVVTVEAIEAILPLNFDCSERLRW